MCQMSVVMAGDGEPEKIMDNVTLLEVDQDGVTVSTMFEPPRRVDGVMVKKIDFLAGTVTLADTVKK